MQKSREWKYEIKEMSGTVRAIKQKSTNSWNSKDCKLTFSYCIFVLF